VLNGGNRRIGRAATRLGNDVRSGANCAAFARACPRCQFGRQVGPCFVARETEHVELYGRLEEMDFHAANILPLRVTGERDGSSVGLVFGKAASY
jgi:hypothetical protein